MAGWWRFIYRHFGWSYPESPSEQTIRARNDTLQLIRENNIKLNNTRNNKSTSKWKTVKRTGKALEITKKK